MTNYGYLKLCAASPRIKLADPLANAEIIAKQAKETAGQGADLILFPELCLTGCSCGDLFFAESLQEKTVKALENLLVAAADIPGAIVVGLPVSVRGRLVNCAAVLQKGTVKGLVPKLGSADLPENRWFAGGAALRGVTCVKILGRDVPFGNLVFANADGFSFAIEVGSDSRLPIDPGTFAALNGAQLILCPAADAACAGGAAELADRLAAESKRLTAAVAYASAGPSECTSDFVYSGQCLAAENGEIIASSDTLTSNGSMIVTELDLGLIEGLRKHVPAQPCPPCGVVELDNFGGELKSLERKYSKAPFLAEADAEYCRQLLEIQAVGLAERMRRAYSKKAVIGVSGGSDSTLAILVAARAVAMLGMDPDSVLAVTMPGFGTTDRTKDNAYGLMESLGCELREISIAANAKAHLEDIGHDMSVRNVAYENAQARERTQVLMDLANDIGGLVVGTGDMSETALGWCTYGGDHLSMYGVNGSLTKGMVKAVIATVSADIKAGVGPFAGLAQADRLAAALDDVLDTPISPELLPPDANGKIAQITEDKVGPYELHDFFLWHMVFLGKSREKTAWLAKQTFAGDYDGETVDKWLATFCRRFSSQQFKRDCAPGGPQAADFSFSPRGGWVMPSDASGELWK